MARLKVTEERAGFMEDKILTEFMVRFDNLHSSSDSSVTLDLCSSISAFNAFNVYIDGSDRVLVLLRAKEGDSEGETSADKNWQRVRTQWESLRVKTQSKEVSISCCLTDRSVETEFANNCSEQWSVSLVPLSNSDNTYTP